MKTFCFELFVLYLCVGLLYLCVLYTKEDETRQGIAALDGCYIEELCSPISQLGRICTFVFLY